ncbi:S8 family serine peptidase [Bradyrhizobium sp. SRL28]|uniref:S8 family serine peptidase n=1 Tax=Bradyrhizobium sp. SRL28 TaxID=2836178 RepID=UPI0035B213E4
MFRRNELDLGTAGEKVRRRTTSRVRRQHRRSKERSRERSCETTTMSGTSMAAPHVTGAVAPAL